MFQFLYGTIKIALAVLQKSLVYVFQFLYGTIKIEALLNAVGKESCFNSSMVQLKYCLLKVNLILYSRFQFLYGTIKIIKPLYEKNPINLF